MSKTDKQVTIWFPDYEVLEKIRELARKNDRGIGYIICQAWKKLEELEKMEITEKVRKGNL